MTRIVVFTDLHFTVEPPHNGIDPTERLARGLAHAAKHVANIDHVILTGDLTHRGDIGSYERLKAELDRHDLPFRLLIGNHDNRENFLSIFPEAKTDENGHVQQAIDHDHTRLLLLDTLDAPPYDYPRSHRGLLCEKRLIWLDQQLASAGERKVVLFMHHPPHPVGFRGMDAIRLVNGPEFYDLVEQHGNVAHICCGHIHRTISGNHRGISFSVFKSMVGQMPMLFDSSDSSIEVNEPPAYGIIDINTNGVTIHTEDYGLTDLAHLA